LDRPSFPTRRSSDLDGYEWSSRFPYTTIRDQVRAQALLADSIGIDRWAAVVGGSAGGMHALEWGVGYPDRVARLAVLAAPPHTTDRKSTRLNSSHVK